MQYNNTITIQSNTYNEFGEDVKASDATLKCCVLSQRKKTNRDNKGKAKQCDLKIIIAAKAFAPYNQVFSDNSAFFIFETLKYRPLVISAIKDFSGKTKYYEIECEQEK